MSPGVIWLHWNAWSKGIPCFFQLFDLLQQYSIFSTEVSKLRIEVKNSFRCTYICFILRYFMTLLIQMPLWMVWWFSWQTSCPLVELSSLLIQSVQQMSQQIHFPCSAELLLPEHFVNIGSLLLSCLMMQGMKKNQGLFLRIHSTEVAWSTSIYRESPNKGNTVCHFPELDCIQNGCVKICHWNDPFCVIV